MAYKSEDDRRPTWARRIRAERVGRRWSQTDAVAALRAHAGSQQLPGKSSLLRNWKRWESGETEPDEFYKILIAKTFGTVTAALFPPDRDQADAHLLSATGLDTLEIISRLQASDVSTSTIEALRITAERLSCDYSTAPSDVLLTEGRDWLRRIIALRGSRLTLAQHRELLSLAGQVALLVGCVEYDMKQRQAADGPAGRPSVPGHRRREPGRRELGRRRPRRHRQLAGADNSE